MARVERRHRVQLALPAFAHLPLLVNEQGKKLSKRRDPVAVEMYREQGYLPTAFRNYLALLGWSPGEEEIVPLETLIESFRIEDVQRSPAFFDVRKLTHMNGVYIRELPTASSSRCRCPGWTPSRASGPRASGTIPTAGRRRAGPPWPAERFDPDVFAADGRRGAGAGRHARRGAGAGRLLLRGGPADRPGQLAEGHRRVTRWRR